MPSGAAVKASDFESWFDLAPMPIVASLSVTPPAVVGLPRVPGSLTTLRLVDAANPTVPASPVLNLSLSYNAIADTQVAITVAGGTAGNVTVPAPSSRSCSAPRRPRRRRAFRRQSWGENGNLHADGKRGPGKRQSCPDTDDAYRDRTRVQGAAPGLPGANQPHSARRRRRSSPAARAPAASVTGRAAASGNVANSAGAPVSASEAGAPAGTAPPPAAAPPGVTSAAAAPGNVGNAVAPGGASGAAAGGAATRGRAAAGAVPAGQHPKPGSDLRRRGHQKGRRRFRTPQNPGG